MVRRIKLRTLFLGGFITLLFFGLIVRIYWVQVANAAFWEEQARKTWITSKKLVQDRGTITDRDGNVLAADTVAYTLAVGPKKLHELDEEHPEWRLIDQIVNKVHLVLNKPESEVRAAVDAKREDGSYLDQREIRPEGWKMDKNVADRLMAFRDQLREQTGKTDVGLYFIEDKKRFYPNGSLASHVLGYENKEGVAVMGLEKTLNDELKGQEGSITYEKDGIRTQLPNGKVEVKQAIDGKNVTLTIDRDIQFYMEEALRAAYKQYNPVSITAIAADPKTMDILGMVSLPDFNPNAYWETKNPEAFKNNAIQSVYEPGSTFKIVTLAAAVQEGLFNPNAYYQSGSISISSRDKPIHDHNWSGWGRITYLDGLKHSSNVAFVKLGYQMLGKEKFKQYIDNFGFGVKTGIELQGEVIGKSTPTWNRDWASATFGQAVTVTPIQQVAAVAAVANGGKLMKPHLVKAITDPATGEKTVVEPEVVRQVISEATSKKVGEYLEQVVSDQEIGTGRNAYIPGYRIAGKTGTAQVYENGKIAEDKYVVSFIGYAPVEDPKIVLYVLVDRPDDKFAGGGSVAAPIFKQIMEQSLRHLGVLPKVEKKDGNDGKEAEKAPVTVAVPDVGGMTVERASAELKNAGFQTEVLGKGGKVLNQLPEPGSVLPTSERVYLFTEKKIGSVPDMKGLSLRDALDLCSLLGATCQATGEGYVIAQQAAVKDGRISVALSLAPPGEMPRPAGEADAERPDASAGGQSDASSGDSSGGGGANGPAGG
jgi:penicillin-binding protein 2B